MAVKRERECGSDGGEVEYEKLRNERLRENQKRMEELGLLSLSKSLSESARGPGFASGRGSPRTPSSTPRSIVPAGPARRSSRLSGSPVVSYSEVRKKDEGKEKSAGRKAARAGTGGFQPEIYTEEDEKLLGSAKSEWRLFVDGYDSKGTRIYDPVRGKTCHQCRQKTMGLRTSCSNCQSLHGQFCGDCLYMRYGENVVEANQNENWECPVCRGICNCSFCRLKRGWTPTGSLYRRIKSLGYQSVAHYLVLTRRGEDEAKAADEVDDKKLESAELKTPTCAPKVENTEEEELPTTTVEPSPKQPEKQEKVLELQSTLLSAGWRSRRAVSTRSKEEKPKNSSSSDMSSTVVKNEAASCEEPQPLKRRGRPPKNKLSGKASFYGSAPKVRLDAEPETVDEEQPARILDLDLDEVQPASILVLDSDTEDSSDRPLETIAHRLRRRVTS